MTSSGMYKSWLGQTPFSDAKSSTHPNGGGFQSLALTMSPSAENDIGAISPLQVVADHTRKRAVSKSLAREPVPRKSIDTFGQRTSQYRGVTRY